MNISKVCEKNLNEYWGKLIYAVFADIESKWDGKSPYNNMLYQNYANLALDKKDRTETKLTPRFTITDETRQMLATMFFAYLAEMKSINVEINDNSASLLAKLPRHDEGYSNFIITVYEGHQPFGENLSKAHDATKWFYSQTAAKITQYTNNILILAKIYDIFDIFLKSLALTIGKFNWHAEKRIDKGVFLGILSVLGFSHSMVDELASSLREKQTKKKIYKQTGEVPTDVMPETITDNTSGGTNEFSDLIGDI